MHIPPGTSCIYILRRRRVIFAVCCLNKFVLYIELGAINKIVLRFLFLEVTNRDSSLVTRKTRLGWTIQASIPEEIKETFSLLKHLYKLLVPRNFQKIGAGVFPPVVTRSGRNSPIHRLAPISGVSEVVPLLHIDTFMAWKWTN